MTSMIRVNFEAATRMAYAALRVFKKQRRGDLITTSSILGLKVRPTVGVYAGTKYAVEAPSESLRMELAGTGVRVMVIEPGYTATHLQEHWMRRAEIHAQNDRPPRAARRNRPGHPVHARATRPRGHSTTADGPRRPADRSRVENCANRPHDG